MDLIIQILRTPFENGNQKEKLSIFYLCTDRVLWLIGLVPPAHTEQHNNGDQSHKQSESLPKWKQLQKWSKSKLKKLPEYK